MPNNEARAVETAGWLLLIAAIVWGIYTAFSGTPLFGASTATYLTQTQQQQQQQSGQGPKSPPKQTTPPKQPGPGSTGQPPLNPILTGVLGIVPTISALTPPTIIAAPPARQPQPTSQVTINVGTPGAIVGPVVAVSSAGALALSAGTTPIAVAPLTPAFSATVAGVPVGLTPAVPLVSAATGAGISAGTIAAPFTGALPTTLPAASLSAATTPIAPTAALGAAPVPASTGIVATLTSAASAAGAAISAAFAGFVTTGLVKALATPGPPTPPTYGQPQATYPAPPGYAGPAVLTQYQADLNRWYVSQGAKGYFLYQGNYWLTVNVDPCQSLWQPPTYNIHGARTSAGGGAAWQACRTAHGLPL